MLYEYPEASWHKESSQASSCLEVYTWLRVSQQWGYRGPDLNLVLCQHGELWYGDPNLTSPGDGGVGWPRGALWHLAGAVTSLINRAKDKIG